MSKLASILGVAVVGVAGVAGYRVVHDRLVTEVYRQRLQDTAAELDDLRMQYNRAVRRAAVTELLVQGDTLSVVIRTPAGVLKQVETAVDPRREVYVDYVVKDGRLWVRRVFDDRTAPERATVIDPSLVDLDWDAAGLEHGKAVYRRLSEGRWLVTVTGSGSLGLRRVGDAEALDLDAAPLIEPFEPIDEAARRDVEAIGVGDVVGAIFGWGAREGDDDASGQ